MANILAFGDSITYGRMRRGTIGMDSLALRRFLDQRTE